MSQGNDKSIIKDISILDEKLLTAPSKSVVLITRNSQGIQTSQAIMKTPVYYEKMVTFSINDVTFSPKLSVPKFRSFQSGLSSLRSILLNTLNEFGSLKNHQTLTFDLRTIEPNNIAHLMMHLIPFCLHVRNVTGLDTKFLFVKVHPPFRKLLDAFDIKPVVTHKKIQGAIVRIVGFHGLASYNILNLDDFPSICFIPETYSRYSFTSPLANKNKIFIARRGSRRLLNHNEIESILNKHGYQTVFMEDYTIEQQLGIASEARAIVAVHGASMGMLSANKQINSLIELCPPNVYHEYFAIALSTIVKKHIQLIPSFDSRVAYNSWDVIYHFKNAPFSADIDQLKLALSLLD